MGTAYSSSSNSSLTITQQHVFTSISSIAMAEQTPIKQAEQPTTQGSRQHPCPKCGKAMERREGKLGAFWGCTDFPSCRATLNDIEGKPSAEDDATFRCPLCTRPLKKAESQQGTFYWFCTGYDKGCQIKIEDDQGKPKPSWRCKDCGQLLVQRESKHGKFWGCSSYPECTATYQDSKGEPHFPC